MPDAGPHHRLPPQDAVAPESPASSYGLRAGVVAPVEILGQSVANVAPTATPTVVIPLVYAAAGDGSWFAYLFALTAVLLVALSINQFARRIASPGSLYTYAALGLGPVWGIAVGCVLLVAYVGCAASVSAGFANYAGVLLGPGAGPGGGLSRGALALVMGGAAAASWWVAYRDVKLSARVSFALEFVSLALILLVIGATLARLGARWDRPQLQLHGLTPDSLRLGLVLAIFSFTGFESATVLGGEAVSPLITIPRAVLQSLMLVGLLFVVCAYAQVAGFRGSGVSLAASGSPLQVLASAAGIGKLGVAIAAVAMLSFFACVLASINAAARVLFLLSRHGLVGASLGRSHAAHRTPHRAVAVVALAAYVPAAGLALAGYDPFEIYGLIGTTATLGFIVCYIAVCVAAPVFLRRLQVLRPVEVIAPAFAIALMGLALVGAIYPWAGGATGCAIGVFGVLATAGCVLAAYVAWRAPQVRERIRSDLVASYTEPAPGSGAPANGRRGPSPARATSR